MLNTLTLTDSGKREYAHTYGEGDREIDRK